MSMLLVRLLHLSKLFMLFQFNDFGAWFSFSRWRTDMQHIASTSQAGLKEYSIVFNLRFLEL